MIRLRPVTAADQNWLVPAFARYLAEIAPDLEPDPIDHWWQEAAREALAIETPARVGFAMVRRTEAEVWDLSEFAIFPQARRSGLGQAAAHQLFAERPGAWQLGVVRAGPARHFWAAALPKTPGIQGLTRHPPLSPSQVLSYRFTIAEGG